MTTPANALPIIASCGGCGACCLVVTEPPFRRRLDGTGEDGWERLRWERPDLHAELLAAARARSIQGAPSFGTPCLWFDAESLQCKHYEYRPRDCREFAVGSQDCRDARRRAGIR